MTFVALWGLLVNDGCWIKTFVALWGFSAMTFVALWCLLVYDGCWIMTFVALWGLSAMTFVALWCWLVLNSVYDGCWITTFVALWGLSSMTFVAFWCFLVKDGWSLYLIGSIRWTNMRKINNELRVSFVTFWPLWDYVCIHLHWSMGIEGMWRHAGSSASAQTHVTPTSCMLKKQQIWPSVVSIPLVVSLWLAGNTGIHFNYQKLF